MLLCVGQAKADLITFEGDLTGAKPQGFRPFRSNATVVASFFSTLNSPLTVFGTGGGAQTRALIVGTLGPTADNTSALRIEFDKTIDFLSFRFGNVENLPAGGGRAFLEVFLNGVSVGSSQVDVNGNLLLDQTIMFSMSGVVFDEAFFQYRGSFGVPLNVREAVDDIAFTQAAAPTAVPEPTSVLLIATGAAGLLAKARRWKQQQDQ